ncbi:PDDEXK nuclease domain-containing protein [Deferribacter abyssi]|uniref:PDDEXK nuclease domain-containing protein n=1 Tax=Deferribacter abyssi TaxID=213806 RepID=UPI003C1BCEF8
MNDKISTGWKNDKKYNEWIKSLKEKFRQVQLKAAVKVNSELLNFYWELGKEIADKQKEVKWGDKFLERLSKDLMNEFPEVKGFSLRNLKYIRQWYLFWSNIEEIGQQAVAQFRDKKVQQAVALITQIPWGHNLVIITKCKNSEEALFYVQKTIENSWSRSVLTHQIESGLYERAGKSITNFDKTLPKPQSDLAKEMLKDPYCFDFLAVRENYTEKELENDLLTNLTKFLLELGAGFSFLGRQYKIEVGEEEFYIDLLFYHVKLHCYIVVELKTGRFKPEYAGKLNFYISAVDSLFKTEKDNPTIGILICKEKDKTIVEYSLRDISKPIGVSEYKITRELPEELKSSLPDIKDIEASLNEVKEEKSDE